jgi:hypothetical protein
VIKSTGTMHARLRLVGVLALSGKKVRSPVIASATWAGVKTHEQLEH